MAELQEDATSHAALDFDHAEFESAASLCGLCRQPLFLEYFDVNGTAACGTCRDRLAASMLSGSALVQALKALALGLVAAIIGSALYYGVTAITGYELGLVAIVLGVVVGVGVRIGSGGRGGWFYQALAMALTYLSVSGAYLSLAVDHPLDLLPALVSPVMLSFLVRLPVLAGMNSPFTFLILGIALYEAWKINKGRSVTISGPYAITSTPRMSIPPPPSPGAPPSA